MLAAENVIGGTLCVLRLARLCQLTGQKPAPQVPLTLHLHCCWPTDILLSTASSSIFLPNTAVTCQITTLVSVSGKLLPKRPLSIVCMWRSSFCVLGQASRRFRLGHFSLQSNLDKACLPRVMSKYAKVHEDRNGPGDSRPTALEIVEDEGMIGKLSGKVCIVTGGSSGIGIGKFVQTFFAACSSLGNERKWLEAWSRSFIQHIANRTSARSSLTLA